MDCKVEALEAEQQEHIKNNDVLAVAKSRLSPNAYKDLQSIIVDSENTYAYSIEKAPKGKFQEHGGFKEITGIWVNQTTNGGMSGDDFAGTVSVELNDKSYFQFHYSL